MSVYVGIDVHRKRSQVAVAAEDGKVQLNRNVVNGQEPMPRLIGGHAGTLMGAAMRHVRSDRPGRRDGRTSWPAPSGPHRTGYASSSATGPG